MKEDILKESDFLMLDIKSNIKEYEENITNNVETMKTLDIINLNELGVTHFPFKVDTILREDTSEEGASLDEIFKNTTNVEGREVVIPKVIG